MLKKKRRTALWPNCLNDFQICLGERIFLQLIHPYPPEVLYLQGLQLARNEFALKRVKGDLEVRVGVIDGRYLFAHFDADAEFLFDLAAQTLRQRLAGFNFAAGEFPQAAKPAAQWPLRDEEASVLADDGRGYIEVGQGLALGPDRQLILQAAFLCLAEFRQRADIAFGTARHTDQRAEFHQCLVEFASCAP